MSGSGHSCPHCGAALARLGLNEAVCDHAFDYACFNDDCPYYVRGWTWMEQQYGVKASYRYRIDALRGFESPVPVWTPTMLRSALLEDDESPAAGAEAP